jgi:hypothetical protein
LAGERVEEVDVDVDLVVVEEVTLSKGSEGGAFVSSVAERDLGRNARPRRVLRLGFGGGESILVFGVRWYDIRSRADLKVQVETMRLRNLRI